MDESWEPTHDNLPGTPMWRAMRAGHKRRTGHDLVAHLDTDSDGASHIVRECCQGKKEGM